MGRVDGCAVHAFNYNTHADHGFDISYSTYHRVDGLAVHPTVGWAAIPGTRRYGDRNAAHAFNTVHMVSAICPMPYRLAGFVRDNSGCIARRAAS